MQRTAATIASLCMLALLAFPAAASADTSFGQMLGQLEQMYQLPTGLLWKVALAENGGKATGCAPTSSACGMFQFITSTWESASKAMFGQPLNPSLRNSPDLSAKVAAFELATIKSQIGTTITQAKVDPSAGLYLGHFLGSGGAKKLLLAYIQNPGQSACALLPPACSANASVMNQSVAGVINWAAKKMQVTGVPNVPGNFADSRGVSYAYSSADVSSANFLPANTPIPPNPYGQYATVFPSMATPPSVATPASTALPSSQASSQSTAASNPVLTANTSATSGSACTPRYYCSNNTVYYASDSCTTNVFQSCQYGCQGTICAPPPSAASTTAVLSAPSVTSVSPSLGILGTVGNPVIITATSSGATISPLLGTSVSTILQGQSLASSSATTSLSAPADETSSFNSVTFNADGSFGAYTTSVSPLSQILGQLTSALSGLLNYLGSL